MTIMSSVRIWLFMLVVVMLVPYSRGGLQFAPGLLTDPGPCHPCHALYTEEFMKACGNYLQPGLLHILRYYCLLKMDNMDYLNEHLTSIEEICSAKYDAVELTIPDCPEIDLVFMVQVSNQVGNIGVEKFISFLTSTLNHDNLNEFISAESIDIGIMSFSNVVEVILNLNENVDDPIEMVNDIGFVGDTTETQDVITEFSNQLSDSTSDRRQVGVLLTVGTSTNWRATALSMLDLYEKHPKVKVIVVNRVDTHSSGCPTGEIRAMATGVGEENLIQIFYLGDLEGKEDELVDMILADHDPVECSQLLVMNIAGEDMKCHEGVYEKTTPCDATHTTYMHTNGQYWMASIDLNNSFRLWMITFGRPDDDCKLQPATKVIAWVGAGVQDEADLLEASWIMVSTHYPEIEVACFN